jgi:hypothetical protein
MGEQDRGLDNLEFYLLSPSRNVSSVGLEHYFDRVGVTGSSPVRSTNPTFYKINLLPVQKSLRLLLIFWLLSISANKLWAQGRQDPYPGCSSILIETRMSGAAAFGSWSRHIESQGLRLDRTDPTLLQLNTLPVSIKKMNCEYFIESKVTDNGTILVQLNWRTLTTDSTTNRPPSFQKWTYAAEKKSVAFTLYNEIMRVVDTYGNYLIWYSR